MQKRKKQILGIAGLLAVGALTTIACSMPAPNAAAAEGSSDVNINVTINEGDTRITILSPLDNAELIGPSAEIKSSYEDASKIEYYLIYTDDAGKEQKVLVETFVPTDASGTHTFSVDLTSYGYRNFRIQAIAYSNGGSTREDTIAFDYRASSVVVNPPTTGGEGGSGTKPGESENPSIDIDINDEVDRVQVQIYDKDGKPVFVDKDGNETPIILNRDQFDAETGKLKVTLPFEEYGLAPGTYTGVVTAYNKDNNILSMSTFEIVWNPTAPETPNTGSTMFGDLNISRIDYIITGLIAFAIASGLAIYLVNRKSHR